MLQAVQASDYVFASEQALQVLHKRDLDSSIDGPSDDAGVSFPCRRAKANRRDSRTGVEDKEFSHLRTCLIPNYSLRGMDQRSRQILIARINQIR